MLRDQFSRTITTVAGDYAPANEPYFFRDVVGGVVGFEVQNTGAAALTGFKVQIKTHQDGDWHDFLTDTDFDDSTIDALAFSTDTGPHELGAGEKAAVIVRIQGVLAIRFLAKSGTADMAVQIRGTVDPKN